MRTLILSTNTEDLMIILWCLKEAGHQSYALGKKSDHKDTVYQFFCKKSYFFKEAYAYKDQTADIIPFIKDIVEKEKIEVILPSGFESVKFIATYRDQIEKIASVVFTPSWEMINSLGNKLKFSEFCKRHDIPHPKVILINSQEDLNRYKEVFTYPIIIKPLDRAGGEGVDKIDSKEILIARLSKDNPSAEGVFPVLAQEFIPGFDIGFNGYCLNGDIHAWTIYHILTIQITPNKSLRWYQYVRNDDVYTIASRVIKQSNYTGPLNMDLRFDSRDKKIKTIEVNPRFFSSTAYSLCEGVNFPDVGIKLSQDKNFNIAPDYSGRIWGSPHWTIPLFLKFRTKKYYNYIFQHSFQQMKYLAYRKLAGFFFHRGRRGVE